MGVRYAANFKTCIDVIRADATLVSGQIKYLRVPDTLLDAVKEEQNKAREAGRSARGAHVSGSGGRGGQ